MKTTKTLATALVMSLAALSAGAYAASPGCAHAPAGTDASSPRRAQPRIPERHPSRSAKSASLARHASPGIGSNGSHG